MEDELNGKISYLGGFVGAFRDQIHTDIQLRPGNNGPSIPAHKALLVSKETISSLYKPYMTKLPDNFIIVLCKRFYIN